MNTREKNADTFAGPSSCRRLWAPLAGIAVSVLLVGCGTSRPIVLTPSLTASEVATVGCPASRARFYLEEVVDKRGNADPRDVGFTQTGMFNRLTTLQTRPTPAEIVGAMFSSFLQRCDLEASDRADADYLIALGLVTLQLTEVTDLLSESIAADLAFELTVRDAVSGNLLKRSLIGAKASRSGIDTTGYAADVIEQSSQDALAQFSRLLECCPGGS